MPTLKRLVHNEVFLSVLFIVLISALAYLPFLNQFGYYRDDWHVEWAGANFGPAKIFNMHTTDRPFMGLSYAATYAVLGLFGSTPLRWQIYMFLVHLAGSLGVLWLARLLQPSRGRLALVLASLFAVYPGFLQMPAASTHQNHVFSLTLGIFSICLTLWGLRQANRQRTRILALLASILLALACYMIQEWLIGLEGVRLALLWVHFSKTSSIQAARWKNFREAARRAILSWLPYLVPLAVFLVWRLLFFKTARAATDVGALATLYLTQPGEMFARLAAQTLRAVANAAFLAWSVPFYELTSSLAWGDLLFALLLALAGGGLWLYFEAHLPFHTEENESAGQTSYIWIGLFCVLITLLPPVLSNRELRFEDTFDRYTLPAMFGATMLVSGMIFGLLRPTARSWAVALLLGVSIFTHTANGVYFSNFWDYQRQLWWQLSWRAPDLKNDTLLAALLPEKYRLSESYEVWGPANLIYRPHDTSLSIKGEALSLDTLLPILRGERYGRTFRRIQLDFDTQNALLMSLPDNRSCLHVLDSQRLELSEKENPTIRLAASSSHIDQIITAAEPKVPPVAVFGSEPKHGWCYYYQKAGLARQKGDWQEITRLGDEAKQRGLVPQDVSEWMPFYDGYAHSGRMDEANQIGGLLREAPDFIGSFCTQKQTEPLPVDKKDRFLVLNLCPQLQ